jgi:GntR family histidine utilization transcriptional repressor
LINLQTVPEAADEEFGETAPGPWLLSQVPWSAAEHKIFAIGVEEEEGAMLSIPPATACLVVERRTWNKSGPVTHVRFVYPGNRHALYARFTPEAVK